MSAVKEGNYNGAPPVLSRWTDKRHSIKGMLTSSGIRDEIKKVLKQPGYDDGSAGPVLVRSVLSRVRRPITQC
jgi:hypothetical protein